MQCNLIKEQLFFNTQYSDHNILKKMNPLNTMLPFLLLLVIFFALFSPVKPDAAFIRNLCSKTEQPVICSDCLRSGPGSQSANGRGLALIAIGCAERNTRLMAQRLGDLVRGTPGSLLKNVLINCWMSTGSTAGSFPGIRHVVAGGDYAGGRSRVDMSIRKVNSCLAEFNKHPTLPVPSVVLAGTVAADQSCRIVSGILNQI